MARNQTAGTLRAHPRGALPTLATLLLALLAGSCGGGNVPTRGDPTLIFSGERIAPPGVHLRLGTGSHDQFLQLSVAVEGLEGAYAVEYDLHYPEELLALAGFSEGDYLREGGRVATRLTVVEASPGVIHVEHTRVGDVGPAPAQEPFVLEPTEIIEWNAHANGTGSFTWSGNRVLDEDGAELPGMSWSTGSVTIQGAG